VRRRLGDEASAAAARAIASGTELSRAEQRLLDAVHRAEEAEATAEALRQVGITYLTHYISNPRLLTDLASFERGWL
jgi:hypothetical protein